MIPPACDPEIFNWRIRQEHFESVYLEAYKKALSETFLNSPVFVYPDTQMK